MSTFNKDGLRLVSQGIVGGRIWDYTDTGALADVADVAGYFALAGSCGMEAGDLVYLHANNGNTTLTVYATALSVVQDTGASQGTSGPATLIGDTG